jgi:hypothetical protein
MGVCFAVGSCLMLCAAACGQAAPQDEAVAKIESLGGRVYKNTAGQVDIVDLKGPQITDEHLALLQSLPALRQLSLDGSQVTDRGLDQLLNLPNLEEVSLLRTKVTPQAAQAFNDRHPKVFHVALSPRTRIEVLAAVGVVSVLMAALGAWLMRTSFRKRDILAPRTFVQGIGYGLLLIVVAALLVILTVLRWMGIAFN